MSLPSQSSRNATRSSQVHYRRSRGHPIVRIGSIAAILIVVLLVWFTLIRPRASKIVEQEQAADNTSQSQPLDAPSGDQYAANSTPQTTTQPQRTAQRDPVVIQNASPGRPLPGAGARPDPNQDLDRALGSNPTADSDILSSAADQAQRTPAANPAGQRQIEDRNAGQTNPPASPGSHAGSGIRLQIDTARRLIAANDRVGARKLLSQTLINASLSEPERQVLRDELTVLNQQLVFSPVADPSDSMTEMYQVQSGDSLSKIANKRELATHWKLIARVNQIADPTKIRLGQNLKLVRGPFHAIVDKSDHRIDIYHGSPTEPGSWVYIRSFDVGLGTADGTPVGEFIVSENKLENPGWVNPRDAREQYTPSDPKNPIGEFWIGLTGVGQYASLTSLGIHGTIDPDSIGSDRSMGCVRLAKGDIDIVYELLAEHISRVLIVP